MRRRKKPDNLTVLIISSPEKPIRHLSIPRWTLKAALLIGLVVLLAIGYFYLDYYRNMQELAALRQEQKFAKDKAQVLNLILYSQQREIREIAQELEAVQTRVKEVDELTARVRALAGLPYPTITPIAGEKEETINPAGFVSKKIAEEIATAQALRDALERQKAELESLEGALVVRVLRIPPEKRDTPEKLQQELTLLAAAPMRWPVDVKPIITSEFGPRIFMGKKDFHTGIDIGVWYKTPVKATKAGKVVFAGWKAGYGLMVEIAHEMGYSTIYAHNSHLLVKKGQEVREGQVIALSGDTGKADGPHLHYEIRLNGKPLDPMIFLSLNTEGK